MMSEWTGIDGDLCQEVVEQSKRCLGAYEEDPRRVRQDAAIEIGTAEGGYGRKQLYELIQNGADALLGDRGRIHVVLREECLYVANEGRPVTVEGLLALMGTHDSEKRGDEIGRFGLGFKSVVAISDSPRVLSRSGSFAFDRDRARRRIREVVPDSPAYPLLRLADPVDVHEVASQDSVVSEMMQWASTIVQVPLRDGYVDLAEDMDEFPAEFLLFSAHTGGLVLEDRAKGTHRSVTVETSPRGTLLLRSGDAEAEWRVTSRSHTPTARAQQDAGERARRESVTVWWAVPEKGRSAVGQIWSFFPTQSRTSVSGIINAPWKLSDDRSNLIAGPFNEELLTEVFPELVAEAWPSLVDPEDPPSVLDLLPARGREVRSWADDAMNEPIFRRLRGEPTLPDTVGSLCRPNTIKLHPAGLTPDQLAMWASVEIGPVHWVHHGVDRTSERRLKAERLVGPEPKYRPGVRKWLEALVSVPQVEASAVAIPLLASVVGANDELVEEAATAKVLLLETGELVAPRRGRVFLRASAEETGYAFVHPDLAGRSEVRSVLDELGIGVLERSGELRNLLARTPPSQLDWNRVWEMARQCRSDAAATVLREELPSPVEMSVHVRNGLGDYIPLGLSLLPGAVLGTETDDDAAHLTDTQFHVEDLKLLTELGAVPQPVLRTERPEEPWVRDYRDLILDAFVRSAKGARPQVGLLQISGDPPPWPLQLLNKLSPSGRASLTEATLEVAPNRGWTVWHRTNRKYGSTQYVHPVYSWLREHGHFNTTFGPVPVSFCLAKGEWDASTLPVATVTEDAARQLQLAGSPDRLPDEAWAHLLSAVSGWEDDDRRARFYAEAARHIEAPEAIVARTGRHLSAMPPREIAAVASVDTLLELWEQGVSALIVSTEDDRVRLMDRWCLQDGHQLLEREVSYRPVGETTSVIDRFPRLRLHLDPEMFELEIQVCDSIDVMTTTPSGLRTRPVPHVRDNDRLLVTAIEEKDVLESVIGLLQLQVDAAELQAILEHAQEQAAQEIVADVRNAYTDEERLVRLVGAESLRGSLPPTALRSIESRIGRALSDLELAGLTRSVHGVGVLRYFRSILEEKGLEPPKQWAGGSRTRRFVTDLGFPPELAGFAEDERPASFRVEGPVDLAPLHDYQLFVTDRIKGLLRDGTETRGMVSLPTGAGKTRVAVQALIEEHVDGGLDGPIVWIAQSDELCEQAVETWSYLWRALGTSGPLTVSRLWGATNEAVEVTDHLQLVVATPQKLDVRVNSAQYEWLTRATVVVVDEAHASIAPMYTRVLEWLGRRARTRRDDKPLIGLTATPFRNTNVEETERLSQRYNSNRLDLDAFGGDPYEELQEQEVLARAQQKLLTGADVEMTLEELAQTKLLPFLPRSVETRLGADEDRNRTIVDSICELPEDWTTLLFATSVDNAMVLAAELTFRGVPAVSISANTDRSARRHYVEEFKRGRIRVITNYHVLAQGFDAPAVNAVYVTRPTFSANMYQQMIGRGLRGPKNGGKKEVLIVNIEDNIQQFGTSLAFRGFEHVWSSPGA
jgi:superfamily II DNA or RNA helicase